MRKMLLVDDERHVVDYLYELFALETNLEVELYKAYSAQEALSALNRTKMDLVISDIKMPGMTGLELMACIAARWPYCRVIFLTGYRSFDDIYQAKQYPKTVYLMKTEDDDVIVEAARKQLEGLEEELRSQRLLKETLAKSTLIEQSLLLQSVAAGRRKGDPLRQEELDQLQIPLKLGAPFLLAAAKLSGGGRFAPILALHSILARQLSPLMRAALFLQSDALAYVLLQPITGVPDPLHVRDLLEDIQASCQELAGLNVSFVLSRRYAAFSELTACCERLGELARYGLPPGERLILVEGAAQPGLQPDELPGAHLINSLKAALRDGAGKEELACLLQRAVQPLLRVRSMHHLGAIERYQSIALLLLQHIRCMKLEQEMAFHLGLYKLTCVDAFESWQEAADYLTQAASLLPGLCQQREAGVQLEVCAGIKQYVAKHLSGDLSLSAIADHIRYNPSYISRMFKQLEGVNLSDYILEQRIDKARELLRDSKRGVGEIALAVGFDSPQYFATVFRKRVGLSPHQYRTQQVQRSL